MMLLLDSFDDCLAVVIHAPQLYVVAILVGIKKNIGSLKARRDWIADAAQIDSTYPPNLSIVCVDNGHYGETGYQKSHTNLGTDLEKMAIGAGIKRTCTVQQAADMVGAMGQHRRIVLL